ncbi:MULTISPECIES: Imm30 family immunity protein [Rhodomicrobium]|uniref:Imm30 family immunity protein n=1 Tax=Rhodomicrobium TaxID=1068 RepID=UPI000B4B6674|nr:MULTISPECIES: Imm30 family immunity protein [Rhodomicrobium]
MNTLEDTVARLRSLSTSNSPGWVREFDAGLAEIIALDDPDAVPLLFGLFDDKCMYDEAMFSLIHTVEHFAQSVYLSHLLAQSPTLVKQAPEWLATLYSRVFNNDKACSHLTRLLKTAPPDVRRAVLNLINELADQSPQIAPKLIKLRTVLTDS